MKPQKGISTTAGIAIIVLAAVILFGGVFTYEYFFAKTPKAALVAPATKTATADQTQQAQAAEWKTYTNTQYGFSFRYPSNYQVGAPESDLMKLPNNSNLAELYGSPDNILITYTSDNNGHQPFSHTDSGLSISNDDEGIASAELITLSSGDFIIFNSADEGPIADIISSIAKTVQLVK